MIEENKCKRQLRNTNPCNPIDNFFKNEKYRQTHSSYLPYQLLNNLTKLPHLTCEDLNKMNFSFQENHKLALQSMSHAVKYQKQLVQRYFPKFHPKPRKSEEGDSMTCQKSNNLNEPQLIRSEEGYSCDEQILYHKMFRGELEHLLMD